MDKSLNTGIIPPNVGDKNYHEFWRESVILSDLPEEEKRKLLFQADFRYLFTQVGWSHQAHIAEQILDISKNTYSLISNGDQAPGLDVYFKAVDFFENAQEEREKSQPPVCPHCGGDLRTFLVDYIKSRFRNRFDRVMRESPALAALQQKRHDMRGKRGKK